MKQLCLKEKKQILLEILDDIHALCERNNVRYYLAYGTLLGAVRHQGFIPWDDDVDIWIPGYDYERLLKILESHSKFLLINNLTNKKWPRPFAKLADARTVVVDRRKSLQLERGIAIDIFPLAYSDDYAALYQKGSPLIRRMVDLYCLENGKRNGRGIKSVVHSVLAYADKLRGYSVCDLQCQLMRFESETDDHEFAGFLASKYGPQCVYRSEWFGKGESFPFEGNEYRVPSNYARILETTYGPNYAQMPPAEKQISNHDVEVYWRE